MAIDDKGTLTAVDANPPMEPRERPSALGLMTAGLVLGAMLGWLISVILFAPPPRYSGIPPIALMTVFILGLLGVLIGGFLSVALRGNRADRTPRTPTGAPGGTA